MHTMKTISERILDVRRRKKLSQRELGDVIGVTAAAICLYEKGRRPIRARDLEKLEALLKK